MVGFVVLFETLNKLYCLPFLSCPSSLPSVLPLPLSLPHSVFPFLPLINPLCPYIFKMLYFLGLRKTAS